MNDLLKVEAFFPVSEIVTLQPWNDRQYLVSRRIGYEIGSAQFQSGFVQVERLAKALFPGREE